MCVVLRELCVRVSVDKMQLGAYLLCATLELPYAPHAHPRARASMKEGGMLLLVCVCMCVRACVRVSLSLSVEDAMASHAVRQGRKACYRWLNPCAAHCHPYHMTCLSSSSSPSPVSPPVTSS